jgi:3-methylfumaryl-CoA hydratase
MTGRDEAGPVVERTERLVPGPAQALAGLLGVPLPDLEREPLPLLWHWVYLLDRPATADLGPDGHPVRHAVPVPPAPGRRRMWAGGSVRRRAPLRIGRDASRRSFVLSSQDKVGRSGAMTFVTVRHEIRQDGRIAVEEDQHLVYRVAPTQRPGPGTSGGTAATAAAPPPSAAPATPVGAPAGWVVDTTAGWAVDTSPTLLFRFSALTYNGHRIHYDRDYARDVEGYPGLVVHGPLQALLMAELIRRQEEASPPGRENPTGGGLFSYRLVAPVFDHEGVVVTVQRDGEATTATVSSGTGRPSATATLTG